LTPQKKSRHTKKKGLPRIFAGGGGGGAGGKRRRCLINTRCLITTVFSVLLSTLTLIRAVGLSGKLTLSAGDVQVPNSGDAQDPGSPHFSTGIVSAPPKTSLARAVSRSRARARALFLSRYRSSSYQNFSRSRSRSRFRSLSLSLSRSISLSVALSRSLSLCSLLSL